MDDFEQEIKQDFLEESSDLLDAAESAFLRLEDERENADLIDEIFRLAHNLKGTSKAVGFDQLAELTHVAENLILKLKNKTFEVNDEIVTCLLLFKDKVFEMIEGLKENFEAQFEIEELKEKLTLLDSGVFTSTIGNIKEETTTLQPDSESESSELLIEHTQPSETSGSEGISEQAIQSLRDSGIDEETIQAMLQDDSVEQIEPSTLPQAALLVLEKVETKKVLSKSKVPTGSTSGSEAEESIRVKLSRIDKMTNLIGELVILQTVVAQRRFEYIQDDLANKSIGQMGKLFKEIQELSMSLRMLPLKSTFQKMNRIVRDTSKALDKNVKLHIRGEETEVDKTVLEKLADPLIHIVRNAVDHGLENSEGRLSSNKSEQGNVELLAYHEGNNLVIQVTDDGGGIDPRVIERKAISKNIIREGHGLSDNQIINLVFHAGFSTKEVVSEVSGRGVGMDVVKTNIEGLGGKVKLASKLGHGSSFKIILPLTLAIIEGIVIQASEEKYVLPLSQVYEISHVKNEEIESFSGIGKLFKLRGEVLPLFFINHKIGRDVIPCENHTVIIVRGLSHPFGVVVEEIRNQQQIVIKKLGADIRNKKGIMGSAIMSDGMPSLILDLFEIFKSDMKSNKAHVGLKERQSNAA